VSKRQGKDSELGVDGPIERLPGAVQAEGQDVRVEDLPGPGKDVSECFMALAEIPAHAHELGTLPRENKTDPAHAASPLRPICPRVNGLGCKAPVHDYEVRKL
jgi:hypothetical protein